MELISADNLAIILLFLVPGIVTLYTRSQLLDGRMPAGQEAVLSYVTISLFFHAVVILLFPDMYSYQIGSATILERVFGFVFVFVIPAVIGIVLGLSTKYSWFRRFLMLTGLSVVHPINSAWDWKFTNVKASWVMVVLKDGTIWRGMLGTDSFISSSAQERDIYLQKVYTIDAEEKWIEKNSSVLITHDQVQSVEFWPKE